MTTDFNPVIEDIRTTATELDHVHTRLTGLASSRALAQEAEDLHSRLLIAAEVFEKATTEDAPSPTEIEALGRKLARICTDTAELVQKIGQLSSPGPTEGKSSLRDRTEQVAHQIRQIREDLPEDPS